MLWVGVGGHRSLLMGMVWVQIQRKMLDSDSHTPLSLKRIVKRTWTSSALSTNESA